MQRKSGSRTMQAGLFRLTSGLTSSCLLAVSVALVSAHDASAETLGASPSWQVTVKEGRMTARVHNAPLGTVLREISQRVPLAVSIQGPVAQAPISVRFQNLTLEEALRKVLEGKEYAIIRRKKSSPVAGTAGMSALREIIVLSAPGGDSYQTDAWMNVGGGTTQPRTPAPTGLGAGPKPGSLIQQLEEMSDVADEDELLPVLARALEDQDLRVRTKALDVLEETLGPIPVRQLARIAETERDPLMRSRALTLLAFRAEGDAGQPLTRALQDPDAEVRELASDLLNQLGLASPRQPVP